MTAERGRDIGDAVLAQQIEGGIATGGEIGGAWPARTWQASSPRVTSRT